jgi:hypothetical protein
MISWLTWLQNKLSLKMNLKWVYWIFLSFSERSYVRSTLSTDCTVCTKICYSDHNEKSLFPMMEKQKRCLAVLSWQSQLNTNKVVYLMSICPASSFLNASTFWTCKLMNSLSTAWWYWNLGKVYHVFTQCNSILPGKYCTV